MNERLAVATAAILGAIGFLLAPWAALNREIGARSTVLLLPERVHDFTGRTEAVSVQGMAFVMVVGLIAFLLLFLASWLPGRGRFVTWLAAGAVLVASTTWGLGQVGEAVAEARKAGFVEEVRRAVERPRGNRDVEALANLIGEADELSLAELQKGASDAGLNVRRLPYSRSGMGPAAFMAVLAGVLALLFGSRIHPRFSRLLDRFLAAAAVPATSMTLALLASAVVVLLLQPTPLGNDVEISGPLMGIAGRIDTLWHAYLTLFADSLGTLPGFLESLKFTTPLIFTGLAVAFGFRAGLFNIGAPGQMILGALGAAAVGIYLPGPALLVAPLAVVAAALGGGLWGALPGWLKARFGANEVINTILLNYIAASLLLFLLSDRPTFAAPALAVIRALLPAALAMALLLLVPAVRRWAGRRPRLSFALAGLLLLGLLVVVALPVANEPAVIVELPFKAPGSEPKSYPLQPEARLAQLPALLGIDRPSNLNVSFLLALLAALFMQVFLWRTKWGYDLRAVGVAPKAAEYGGADIGRNVIAAMAVSGAFAGLTATHYVLGGALEDYSLRQSLPTGDGFDGIAVALLGGNTPLGVVLSAFLFGVLKNGGSVLNITFSDLTRDVVSMILALVVLFIAAKGFLPERLANPLRRKQALYSEQDPLLSEPIDPSGAKLRSEEG